MSLIAMAHLPNLLTGRDRLNAGYRIVQAAHFGNELNQSWPSWSRRRGLLPGGECDGKTDKASRPVERVEELARREGNLTAAEVLTRENARKAAYAADKRSELGVWSRAGSKRLSRSADRQSALRAE
jgi:hypothetical protein